ncbi:MAG: Rab family GTPase [Candidatus Hodarchaeota archaeon]
MLVVKIALLGEGAVGKTSLRQRFMGQGFEQSYSITIGADFASKQVTLSSGKAIKYQIWDLAGQGQFKMIRNMYFKGCMGALAVFDVTRPISLEALEQWCQDFWTLNGAGPRPIVTLGNKMDLVEGAPLGTTISMSKGEQFAKILASQSEAFGAKSWYFPTSAKTGLNVNEAFIRLGDFIIDYLRKNPEYGPPGGV